ncbi:phytanoyl-CoA dioxygenase domain-containing protein 1-like isoform X2 [Amblyomma americanum]
MDDSGDLSFTTCVEQFHKNGLISIPDFLSEQDVNQLKQECERIVDSIEDSKGQITVFSTRNHEGRNKYFLDSGDKIRAFYEEDAFDEHGNLVVSKSRSINKIGHALHWLNPVFRRVTFSSKVKALVKEIGLKDPRLVQSMYIFKNPEIGGEVTAHQDATFLYTEPSKLIGLWFPLEDATMENGCLWYIPGSHNSMSLSRRFIRNNDPDGPLLKMVDISVHDYSNETFVPVPVCKGSCVVIHGNVVHKSEKNCSLFPRPAYTFHIIDRDGSEYSPQNWLQPSEELPFPSLYENS